MLSSSYTLDIVSRSSQFSGKTLRKHFVDEIETVGATSNEPFEIRFKNNTWQRVQVKLSVDGIDLLSGKPADTQTSKDMWLVEPYATLSLRAFPETTEGGAAFLFTSADKGVALHTTGDLSSRGIIAAAVYVEGHVEPQRLVKSRYRLVQEDNRLGDNTKGSSFNFNDDGLHEIHESNYSCNNLNMNEGPAFAGAASSSLDLGFDRERSVETKGLKELVSVGAGQFVSQGIKYVKGLTKPVLSETVRVRYLWWSELSAKLEAQQPVDQHPSGFPGDSKPKKIMSIGGTPRLGRRHRPRSQRTQTLSRF